MSKDVLIEFMNKKLSIRLLQDKSSSDDDKTFLVIKLRNIVGAQSTTKLEGMIKDIKLMREKQIVFQEYLESTEKNTWVYDFSVLTLTSGFWPQHKVIQADLPQAMQEPLKAYQDHFSCQNTSKKILWVHGLDTIVLKSLIGGKKIEMNMTLHQGLVCLLFNDKERYTFEEILNHLGMESIYLKKIIHSMLYSKTNILTKTPMNNTILDDDIFMINDNFKTKTLKLKIVPPANEEHKKVKENVGQERKFSIDASIVRVMKSRKRLNHNQLLMEVHQQLSRTFTPEVKMIKQRIEDLIDREFIERDRDEANYYNYLA
jgi:cullin 1